jgi:hypothetical protein
VNGSTVFEVSSAFFDRLDKNEKARTELKRYNRIVQLHVSDGKDVCVRIHDGNASVTYSQTEKPDLEMRADTAIYRQLFNGELSPGKAWWDKKLWLGPDEGGWVDTSIPDYPWFTRILHWFAPGTDKLRSS